jgi:protein-S-isoprenylcysteine O-methyltransferase Ste14
MLSVYPHRPDLLDERSKAPVQTGQPAADKVLLLALFLSFLGLLVFVPLDVFHLRALGLTELPVAAVGLVLFVLGATVITLAMRENAFAAPVVRHQEERGQVVVSTGPYGIVRHPMYAGALPSTIGMALWLGSYAAAVAAAIPITLLVLRVLAEERLLRRELAGYDAYTQKVRWRLVPFVW